MKKVASIQKTKELFKTGMINLLKKKLLTDITIIELCEESKVSRRTFYRYYNNTMELIEEIVKETIELYTEELRSQVKKGHSVDDAFYSFWYKEKELIHLLTINGLIQMVFLPSLEVLIEFHNTDIKDDQNEIDLIYQHGGMWSVLVYIISNNIDLYDHKILQSLHLNINHNE
ncbi:TetR/AcrR family transcriptional regulator [Facklamia sp. DSM 111018]|uniref:TetR/AcrR family transcriptional regulator n=1 Tax=Facklamia lactis TaxID=2749967 RepID=A0ABS0LQQ4_9LACT|nr:TetR/AcrR family transcriptional regulator [Facklamia lactis]MBG9986352.1 TetR/AcrR family transcriptional regulator [Facklamia lactis]